MLLQCHLTDIIKWQRYCRLAGTADISMHDVIKNRYVPVIVSVDDVVCLLLKIRPVKPNKLNTKAHTNDYTIKATALPRTKSETPLFHPRAAHHPSTASCPTSTPPTRRAERRQWIRPVNVALLPSSAECRTGGGRPCLATPLGVGLRPSPPPHPTSDRSDKDGAASAAPVADQVRRRADPASLHRSSAPFSPCDALPPSSTAGSARQRPNPTPPHRASPLPAPALRRAPRLWQIRRKDGRIQPLLPKSCPSRRCATPRRRCSGGGGCDQAMRPRMGSGHRSGITGA